MKGLERSNKLEFWKLLKVRLGLISLSRFTWQVTISALTHSEVRAVGSTFQRKLKLKPPVIIPLCLMGFKADAFCMVERCLPSLSHFYYMKL